MKSISTKNFAEMQGISIRRVQQLVAQGFLPSSGHGELLVPAAFRGFVDHRVQNEIAKLPIQNDGGQRVRDARAADIELRTAERKRAHIVEAQAEAVAVIDEYAGQLRSDLMAIPARVTADIAMRRRMEDEIDEAFGAAGDRATAAASLTEPPSSPALNRAARRAAASDSKRR